MCIRDSDGSERYEADLPTSSNSSLEVEDHELSLHVYLDLKFHCRGTPRDVTEPLTKVYTSREKGMRWFPSLLEKPAIGYMRTVELNNQLYSLKLRNEHLTFDVNSSVDLFANTKTLTHPDFYQSTDDLQISMCCDRDNIYALCADHLFTNANNLSTYNCVLDQWFPVNIFNEEFVATSMSWYNGRLYMIGANAHSRCFPYQSRAYDHRAGKVERLSNCRLRHYYLDECCVHKEKIYASWIDTQSELAMEAFNVTAGKWDIVLSNPHPSTDEYSLFWHRLASFDDKLWMFSCRGIFGSGYPEMLVQTYDSFLESWTKSTLLKGIIHNDMFREQPDGYGPFDLDLCTSLTDVIVFKPLQS